MLRYLLSVRFTIDNKLMCKLRFNLIYENCCRHFINWIFHGTIDDPCKELFIEFTNHYVSKTKHFFDKAYQIKRQSVPGFLQGWEDSILTCGKYSNLLRQYKPTVEFLLIVL